MKLSKYNDILEQIEYICKNFNSKRKASKNKWIFLKYSVNNKVVLIKSFNTYIQVIKIDELKDSGPMDCKVKECQIFLRDFLNSNAGLN